LLSLVIYDCEIQLLYDRAKADVSGDQGASICVEMPVWPDVENKKGLCFVGEVEDALGVKIGDVLTSDSVAKWVGEALCTELTTAGFAPEMVDALPPRAERGISTRVKKVWVAVTLVDVVPVAVGEVHFRTTLHRGGEVVKEFDSRSVRSGGAESGEEAIKNALSSCMKSAVPIVVTTLE